MRSSARGVRTGSQEPSSCFRSAHLICGTAHFISPTHPPQPNRRPGRIKRRTADVRSLPVPLLGSNRRLRCLPACPRSRWPWTATMGPDRLLHDSVAPPILLWLILASLGYWFSLAGALSDMFGREDQATDVEKVERPAGQLTRPSTRRSRPSRRPARGLWPALCRLIEREICEVENEVRWPRYDPGIGAAASRAKPARSHARCPG